MGNCIGLSSSNQSKNLPIDNIFEFPSSLPTWLSGEGFGSGTIDLGELIVCQLTTFIGIWASYEGGQDDLGVTFFEPSNIPQDFFMLGSYVQQNSKPLFGWILVVKDNSGEFSSLPALEKPTDYELVWSSESLNTDQDGCYGYIWQPIPPPSYKAVGHVITDSLVKPSVEKIRCVRDDLTDESEINKLIWEQENMVSIYGLEPKNWGIQEQGVSANTFISTTTSIETNCNPYLSITCLKNKNFPNLSSYMPNKSQIEVLFQSYSPIINFYPKETYLPLSISWYFSNNSLLYQNNQESNHIAIEPNDANLPQDDSGDGLYWLDLPVDENAKALSRKGNLRNSEVYLQVKPTIGGIFSDIVIWIFNPYNGPSKPKLELVDLTLEKPREHIGDWEHITLRISNFNGILYKVYLSQHVKGTWYDASMLEYFNDSNKFVAYSSLHDQMTYPKPWLVLQGSRLGIRNDISKNKMVLDIEKKYSFVADAINDFVAEEPPSLNYARKWDSRTTYTIGVEVDKTKDSVNKNLKSGFQSLVDILPNKVLLGEKGRLALK